MFDRKTYKEIAKKQLKGRWSTPVLMTLFILGIVFLLQTPAHFSQIMNLISISKHSQRIDIFMQKVSNGFISSSLKMNFFFIPLLNTSSFLFLLSVITAGILNIAQAYTYLVLSHTTGKQKFSTFINGFSLWLKGLAGYLWFLLWVALWSFLLIIPGIVKGLSYSQMFFILAEYPDIGVRRAMQLSKEMTNGYKADLFVMEISFIGWAILADLSFGIGYLWLIPYQKMSFTNAYHALKAKALQTGRLTQEDFSKEHY